MILLITLCYLALVLIAFKVVKIRPTPVSIAVAVLVGVFVLGGIVIAWKFSAPMTPRMTVNRPVVPLVASQNTKEVIKKVHVKVDQPVKKGDLLYEVETAPFQYRVDQAQATVVAARKKLAALGSAVAVAKSQVDAAKAAREKARHDLQVAEGVSGDDPGAVAKVRVDVARFTAQSATAAVEVAVSAVAVAEFEHAVGRESLAQAEVSLRQARLELDRAYTRAPADGHIMNWQVKEGTMTTTVITSAQGTFQDMTETTVLAVFRQNLLRNVEAGDVVEVAFKSFPRRIVTGKVEAVMEHTGEGQLPSSGVLPSATTVGSKGFLVVRVKLDDQDFAKELPLGGAGTAAIYTKVGKPFHLVSKIALRMQGWLYYLPI
jgi:multidrug resistance efflux pump